MANQHMQEKPSRIQKCQEDNEEEGEAESQCDPYMIQEKHPKKMLSSSQLVREGICSSAGAGAFSDKVGWAILCVCSVATNLLLPRFNGVL